MGLNHADGRPYLKDTELEIEVLKFRLLDGIRKIKLLRPGYRTRAVIKSIGRILRS